MIVPLGRTHEDGLIERFSNNPEYAAFYLNSILEDGDARELLDALQLVVKAFGGIAEVAEKTHLNANTLYRTLSRRGNPELTTLVAILDSIGMRLSITTKGKRKPQRAKPAMARAATSDVSARVARRTPRPRSRS